MDTNLCSIILREQFTKTANPNRENDGGIAKICHFLFHDRVQKFVYMTFFILGSFNFFFLNDGFTVIDPNIYLYTLMHFQSVAPAEGIYR